MNQRVRPIWIVAAALLLIFAGFRGGLMLVSSGAIRGAGAGQIARCFLVGIRYDAVPVAYALLPMIVVLSVALNGAFRAKWFKWVLTGYAALIVMGAVAIEAIGAAFYMHFGSRLNWLALEHVGHFGELGGYIMVTYPVWWVLAGWVAAVPVVGLGLYKLFWRGRAPTDPVWVRPMLLVILVTAAVLACRGSLGHHPLRFGPANFSQNKAVVELTLNNVFTLAVAIRSLARDSADEESLYPLLPPPDRAVEVVSGSMVLPGEELVDPGRFPCRRRVDTGRPMKDYNIVIVLMEGMSGRHVGALGYEPSQTPVLDELCAKGVFFERMYAIGTRSSRSVVGTLCGHPDLRGRSLMKRSRGQGTFLTLPAVLQRRGYRTLFVYGGEPDFDNMKGFFNRGGIEEFISAREMDAPGLKAHWGYHDEVVFQAAHKAFVAQGDRKFFGVIFTVSNHEPFDVPAGRTEFLPSDDERTRLLNAYRYADWAIGEFLRVAERASYFKRTIFVLLADHGRMSDKSLPLDVVAQRIPCLIYAPGIVRPRRISTVVSQMDIAPTVLSLLGGKYEHGFMGRSALDVAPGEGFAFMREGNRLAVVRGDRALIVRPGGAVILYSTGLLTQEPIPPEQADPDEVADLQLRALSYHSMATYLYRNALYPPPAEGK